MKILSYIRKFFVWTLLACVAVYCLAYIILSINAIQNSIANVVEKHLSSFLDSKVEIEKVKISPFNKASIVNIVIYDQKNDTLFYADKVNASIKLFDLIDNKVTVNSATVYDFYINTYKEDKNSPINAKFIIEKFRPQRDKNRNIPKVSVNTLLLQNGAFKYNILNAPNKENDVLIKTIFQ